MRKNLKTRLAVFLCMVMILPAIVAALPMTATNVFAASNTVSLYWQWYSLYDTIQVEKGQEFYIGDFVGVASYGKTNQFKTATDVKAAYSSSKKSVATVNSKGYFTAKAEGTTKLTIKYGGQKISTNVTVVAAGSFERTNEVSGLKKKAEAIAKKTPSKITTKNGFELYKLTAQYRDYAENAKTVTETGFLVETVTQDYGNGSYYSKTSTTNKLVVPEAGKYYALNMMLRNYAEQNNPTGTKGAKLLKVKSVSANTSAITVKLKKKVSTEQVLAARILYGDYMENDKLSGKTKANISVYVTDKKTSKMYRCTAQLKKGSNTLKLVPYEYSATEAKYVKTKLQKGHSYRFWLVKNLNVKVK